MHVQLWYAAIVAKRVMPVIAVIFVSVTGSKLMVVWQPEEHP